MFLFCYLGHSHREMDGWVNRWREREIGRLTDGTVLRMCGNTVPDNREYTPGFSLKVSSP